jgi:hypothetical protein
MIELREKCLRALADFLNPPLQLCFRVLMLHRPWEDCYCSQRRIYIMIGITTWSEYRNLVGLTRLNFMTDTTTTILPTEAHGVSYDNKPQATHQTDQYRPRDQGTNQSEERVVTGSSIHRTGAAVDKDKESLGFTNSASQLTIIVRDINHWRE